MKNKINYFLFIGLGIILSGCASPTIQKKINVTENLRSWDSQYGYNMLKNERNLKGLSSACFEVSISKKTFDDILGKGGKVITSSEWSTGAKYRYYYQDEPKGMESGTCLGSTYIIEGPKKLLEKY